MLRYTARYLLSRTLRTVLSKYLLDVDVDSVVIPVPYGDYYGGSGSGSFDGGAQSFSSAHGDDGSSNAPPGAAGAGAGADGGSSDGGGWGVRLSNVRLREGVSLMTLPGRRKRVVVTTKRRRRIRRRQEQEQQQQQQQQQQRQHEEVVPTVTGIPNNDTNPEFGTHDVDTEQDVNKGELSALQRAGRQTPRRFSDYSSNNNRTPGTPGSMDNMEGVFLSPSPSYDSSYSNSADELGDEADHDASDDGYRYEGGRRGGRAKERDNLVRYDVLSRSPASGSMSPRSRPPTPPASSWVCFARGGSTGAATSVNHPAAVVASAAAVSTNRGDRYDYDDNDNANDIYSKEAFVPDYLGRSETKDCYTTGLPTNQSSRFAACTDDDQIKGNRIDSREVADKPPEVQNDDGDDARVETSAQDSTSSFEYYEEETTIEEEMELKVGHGGRIGTLHVRIIGKDYHITVEDADLVLEIAPTASAHGKDKGSNEDADETIGPKSKLDAATVSENNVVDPTSTEDKVMQSSRLARILAAIPNLYLRDCRVRVVMKSGGNESSERNSNKEKAVGDTSSIGSDEGGKVQAADEASSSTEYLIGIDFLSVTGGEDFLAHVRSNTAENGGGQFPDTERQTQTQNLPSFREGTTDDKQHEFLRKRVRTGRGPGGGIFFQVLSPADDKRRYPQYFSGRPDAVVFAARSSSSPSRDNDEVTADGLIGRRWAIRSFANSSNMCIFRLSGLDVHARILLGRREELAVSLDPAQEANTSNDDDYYYDYDADLVVFGVDYVGITSNSVSSEMNHTDKVNNDAADVADEIESIPLRSNFHRLSRGMRRHACKEPHLPSQDCFECWSYTSAQSPPTRKRDCRYEADAMMPLPGLVLYFAITDPLELNIERQGLESLHVLKDLFTPPGGKDAATKSEDDQSAGKDAEALNESSAVPTTSFVPPAESELQVDDHEKFPPFMRPESVHVVGLHVANFCLRLHAMRSDGGREDGLSFFYWEMKLDALTLDSQNLNAKELAFKDTRISIAEMLLYELKGVCRKRVLSIGLDATTRREQTDSSSCGSASSVELCTAATLLDISAPYDALALLHRNENALHLRFINVPISSDIHPADGTHLSRGCIDVKVGALNADLPSGFYPGIMTAKSEALSVLTSGPRNENETSVNSGQPESNEQELSKNKNMTSSLEYTIRLDGGKFSMRPRIKFSFPATALSGGSSSSEGFSIQSVFNHVKVEYGQRPIRPRTTDRRMGGNISILQLAKLAEALRLRILLYLDDLSPLENALDLAKPNKGGHSFMRCHSINQRIGQFKVPLPSVARAAAMPESQKKTQRRERRKVRSGRAFKGQRKQHLVEKLMKMDEAELEKLLAAHELS